MSSIGQIFCDDWSQIHLIFIILFIFLGEDVYENNAICIIYIPTIVHIIFNNQYITDAEVRDLRATQYSTSANNSSNINYVISLVILTLGFSITKNIIMEK